MVIYNIVYNISEYTYFGLKILDNTFNDRKIKILLPNHKTIKILITNDKLYVNYHNFKYVYDHKPTKEGIYLILNEYEANYHDKYISEIYDDDLYKLRIWTKNKTIILEIPHSINIDTNYNVLNKISYQTTIFDLINLYYNYFYPKQAPYHLKNISTITIIEENKETIIKFKNGQIINREINEVIENTTIKVSQDNSLNPNIVINNLTDINDLKNINVIIEQLVQELKFIANNESKRRR